MSEGVVSDTPPPRVVRLSVLEKRKEKQNDTRLFAATAGLLKHDRAHLLLRWVVLQLAAVEVLGERDGSDSSSFSDEIDPGVTTHDIMVVFLSLFLRLEAV